MSPTAAPTQEAIEAGTAFVAATQASSGAIPSYASSLLDEPAWVPDDLNFVSALTVLALDGVDHPAVDQVRAGVARYLLGERERDGLWRYWSRASELHDYTPPDADDTACCSLAVDPRANHANVALLLANRDEHGRFYTWFVRHDDARGLRLAWRLRDERTAATKARRAELWANSEASPDDVDVTVNANVVRYLGPGRAPAEVVRWISAVVEAGTEVDDDHWYRSRTSLYRAIVASAAQGVVGFEGLAPVIIDRLTVDPGPDGLRSDLERADALRVLIALGAPRAAIDASAADLLDRQTADGSWARSICYYGGPQESFGWASESLATAAAVGALHALGSIR